MENMILFIGGLIIALFVGILTGVFGVGGGFLLTPALMIILGVPGTTAVGTGLATILATSSFGIFKRRGTGTVDSKIAFTIAVGSIIGVVAGVTLLNFLKYMPPLLINGREVVAVQYILLWAFTLMLAWVAGFMLFDYHRTRGKIPQKRIGLFAKVNIPPYGNFKSLEQPQLSLVTLVLLGIIIGLFIGLMGIGGGVILLPALIYLVGQRTIKATGTSLLLVWISSLVAVIFNAKNGNISLLLWIALTTGGLTGTFLGTKIGLKAAGSKLRLYFVYVIVAAILLVGFKVFQLTFGPPGIPTQGH